MPTPPLTLVNLYAPFPDTSDMPAVEALAADDLPPAVRPLLDHPHHMTVTVEEHYGAAVKVKVIDAIVRGSHYARKIVLQLETTARPVQFGIVHVDLDALSPPVRAEIVAGLTPLGRVLIRHDVLREVRPSGFFQATLTDAMAGWLAAEVGATTYGRLGVITAEGRPAVWVAEILAPGAEAVPPTPPAA